MFKLAAACTGANEKRLRKAGIAYLAVHLHPGSHAGYYPGAAPIAIKLLFAPGTGKLLGAQAVGPDGVDKRIDVLATALKAGMTVHDIAELELAYAPPFGSAKDPINLAGMAAQNVLAGDVALAQWHEVNGLDTKGTFVLDVRTEAERKAGFIPGSTHIPLHELRHRLGEFAQGSRDCGELPKRPALLLRLPHAESTRLPHQKSDRLVSNLENRSERPSQLTPTS